MNVLVGDIKSIFGSVRFTKFVSFGCLDRSVAVHLSCGLVLLRDRKIQKLNDDDNNNIMKIIMLIIIMTIIMLIIIMTIIIMTIIIIIIAIRYIQAKGGTMRERERDRQTERQKEREKERKRESQTWQSVYLVHSNRT